MKNWHNSKHLLLVSFNFHVSIPHSALLTPSNCTSSPISFRFHHPVTVLDPDSGITICLLHWNWIFPFYILLPSTRPKNISGYRSNNTGVKIAGLEWWRASHCYISLPLEPSPSFLCLPGIVLTDFSSLASFYKGSHSPAWFYIPSTWYSRHTGCSTLTGKNWHYEREKGRNKGGEVTKSNVRRKYSQGKAYIIGKVSKSSQTVILHADGIHCKRSIRQINREVLNAHFLIVCYNLET